MTSSLPNPLPRSISESSFLLVSPLPSFPDLFTPSKLLYLLPCIALADLITNVVLGVLMAGKEEMGLVAWGVFRAALVGWIGWGRGVRRGGSGGGGWVAGTSMISLLLVFWQLNLLFQTRSPAHRPSPPSNYTSSLDYTFSTAHSTHLHPFTGRGLKPHYVFLLTTTLFAFLEYTTFLSLNRLLPTPPHTPRAGAFAIRSPKQVPSPHAHYTTSIPSPSHSSSASFLSPQNQNQNQTNPSHFLRGQRNPSSLHHTHSSSRTNPSNPNDPERNQHPDEHFSDDDDDEESDISDSEIVDIDIKPSSPSRPSSTLDSSNAALERSLSRSFSRRRGLVVHEQEEEGEEGRSGREEGGYGTFGVEQREEQVERSRR
ncbi:hypothetical protein BDY24DRAFT_402630 [Mrakia frigida]|uniref:uncharacterized protein n=1 Tax=Mrakia frigida TaxID=29902 RepID=UPI003FCC13A7